jgi:hypothetical protein
MLFKNNYLFIIILNKFNNKKDKIYFSFVCINKKMTF